MSSPLAQLPRIKVERLPLAGGDSGIFTTVAHMKRIVAGDEGAANPQIRALAEQIISRVPSRDYAGERNALFNWVKQTLKFRGEYGETLQTPIVTLQLGAGDCDDYSTLLASLLESIGHETQFKVIAINGSRQFSHVYIQVRDKATGQWIPLDATVDQATPGWEAPNISRARTWSTLNGLGDAAQPANPWLTAFNPLIQAAAVRVAGQGASYSTGTFQAPGINASFGSGSSLPAWLAWGGGLGVFALLVASLGGRRRR